MRWVVVLSLAGLFALGCGEEGLSRADEDARAIYALAIPRVLDQAGGVAGGKLMIFDASGYGFETLEQAPYRDRILTSVDAGLLDAFVLANQESVPLDPRLIDLEVEYFLEDRARALESCARCDPGAACDCWALILEQYQGLKGMLTLSTPAFQGDQALVHLYFLFGSLGCRMELVLLQKQAAGWAILDDLLLGQC